MGLLVQKNWFIITTFLLSGLPVWWEHGCGGWNKPSPSILQPFPQAEAVVPLAPLPQPKGIHPLRGCTLIHHVSRCAVRVGGEIWSICSIIGAGVFIRSGLFQRALPQAKVVGWSEPLVGPVWGVKSSQLVQVVIGKVPCEGEGASAQDEEQDHRASHHQLESLHGHHHDMTDSDEETGS